MSNNTRTHNSLRNMIVGISTHVLTALFSFVSRTVFVRILGVQYLGISGLFSNILTMLALSDLGVYTVMVYSLYAPIANRDHDKIRALIRFFQRLYNGVALVVLTLGLLCIPLLPYLVNNSTLPYSEMLLYYILLLLHSVCTYFAISRSTLLRADQQTHIVQTVSAVSTFGLQVMQIVILALTHQYAIYLIVQILFTLGSNGVLSWIATKKYPYLKGKENNELVADAKKEVITNLKATFLYKIGNTIMNSTDNLLISVIVGTVAVGYYSNYVTIFTMVNSFVMIVIQAVLPSVGNYYATQNEENKYGLFRFLMLAFYALATFCTSCYICGMNDFIALWLGEEFVLGGAFVLVLSFNRFVFCTIHPLWMTRESTGVFVSTRYLMLCAAALNIILSIALGLLWGVTGIILATALSQLLTVFWYEPRQLFRQVFKRSTTTHWVYVLRLLCAVIPVIAVACLLKLWFVTNFAFLLLKFVVCALVTLFAFFVVMGRTPEFKRALGIAKRAVHKVIKKTA